MPRKLPKPPRKNNSRRVSKPRTHDLTVGTFRSFASRFFIISRSDERSIGVRGKSLRLGSRTKAGVLFLLVGATCLLVYFGWRIYRSRILSFDYQPVGTSLPQTQVALPTSINFPKLNFTLSVEPATITDGTWEVSAAGASHWNNSASPGQGGNIVIYGHNKQHLFGPIRTLKVGDKVELTDTSSKVHRYTITNTIVVPPTKLDYILPTTSETLTLYTCTGFLDRKRFVITAKPDVI